MSLLIDADYILYKNAAGCETETDFGDDVIVVSSRFSDLQRSLKKDLERIRLQCRWPFADDLILFFSSSDNFRKHIAPDYKGHRNRKKPCGYKRAIEWLKTEYDVRLFPKMEADDAIGITATKEDGHVVVSPDKDLRQIPGILWDLTSPKPIHITPEQGRRWHLIQTLAGDSTDGYSGCPGIGVVKAEKLLDKHGESWNTITDAFLKAGLTEEDALTNARLARILTHELYDDATESIRLWTPSD